MDTTIGNTKTQFLSRPSMSCTSITSTYLLGKHDIHTWIVNLDNIKTMEEEKTILSESERSRAERLISLDKRIQYIESHIALRKILSSYTGMPAKHLLFDYSENGKPSLSSRQNKNNIKFNLSHSNSMMILAITRNAPVGIDIERIDSISNMGWIADTYFSSRDADILRSLNCALQLATFYRFWTLKEAYGKCSGVGLHLTPEIEFSKSNKRVDWERKEPFYLHDNGYWFHSFLLEGFYAAGLTVFSDNKPNMHFYTFG